MVRNGYAWAYDQYVTDKQYCLLQNQAQLEKKGLWIDKSPIKPSDFRREQKKSNLMKALDETQTRPTQFDNLMSQINKTTDLKSIAELQARISAENASIQNMATHMQIYDRIAAQNEKIAEQQERNAIAQRILNEAHKTVY